MDASDSQVFSRVNPWNPDIEQKNFHIYRYLLTSTFSVARSLFEKFRDDQKVAAMYEIQKSYGLFQDSFPLLPTKSVEESEKLRNLGNDQFAIASFGAALKLYQKSVGMAPKNSCELALAYSNRSLTLLKLELYEFALLDVNRALQGNCPDTLKQKLLQRKLKCVNEVKRIAKETPLQFTVRMGNKF